MGSQAKKLMLSYLWFRLRAKGRHGTHSPFVYRLVEEVLREQGRPALPAHMPKRRRFLLKLIHFLGVRHLVLLGEQPGLAQETTDYFPNVCLQRVDRLRVSGIPDDALLVLSAPDGDTLAELQKMNAPERLAVLVEFGSKEHRKAFWTSAIHLAAFPFTIDLWFCGLLIRNPDFLRKQHFFLR